MGFFSFVNQNFVHQSILIDILFISLFRIESNVDYISIIETLHSYLSLEYARCEINPHLSKSEDTQTSIQDCDTTPSNDRCHEKVCI